MNSKVALVKIEPDSEAPKVCQAVSRALALVGAPEEYCSKREVVLVKPNFGAATAKGSPSWRYVSPAVARATLRVFSDWGCRVLVGEDTSLVGNTRKPERPPELPRILDVDVRSLCDLSGAELRDTDEGLHKRVGDLGITSRHALTPPPASTNASTGRRSRYV